MKLKLLAPWKESYDKPRQCIKKQRHHFADKGSYSQSSHIWMWELDHKEGWVLKNWCFWTVVLEKALETPLDSKEIKPVSPKGKQPWIFIGRTDSEALILWPSDGEGPTHWKRHWCWERLRSGGEGDDRGWDGWMASSTQLKLNSLNKVLEIVKDREAWCAAGHGVTKSWTWPSHWTTTNNKLSWELNDEKQKTWGLREWYRQSNNQCKGPGAVCKIDLSKEQKRIL